VDFFAAGFLSAGLVAAGLVSFFSEPLSRFEV